MSDRHLKKRPCLARPRWAMGLVLALVSLAAPSTNAQWRVLKSFPAQVRSVFFLDRQGSANTGFVGLVNGEIWKTLDNGANWSKSLTPLPNLVGIPVSSFAFKDQSTGWAGVSANSSYNGVWKTVDGGATWTRLSSITGNIVSVGYNVSSGVLVAISWTGAAQLSNDEGGTWTSFAAQYQNGVWFDGNVGVIANLRAPSFLYTNDGGKNWTNCSPTLPTECWSPWIFPGTSTFAAVSEKSREVLISSNAGMSWSVKYTFPLNAVPRGSIMGGGTDLYVHTSQGYYVSHDTGVNWFSLCGPSSDLDTRFYAKGPEIFSGEFGSNLWYLPNAGASTLAQLAFSSDVYTTSAARCTTQDSTFVFKLATTCSTVLTSVQLLQGAPQFQLVTGTLPRTVFGGADSIRIRYTPGTASRDTGLVRLRFTAAGRSVDTVIPLYATARGGASRVAVNTTLTMTLEDACSLHDTSVTLRNVGCDSVLILSAAIDDPTHITLAPLALPKTLASSDSLVLRITGGSHVSGTYFTTLRLHVRTSAQEFDTSIAVWMTVRSAAKPSILPLALRIIDRCTTLDTAMQLLNPSCDSIQILAVRLWDTTVFQLRDRSFPRFLSSNGSAWLRVYASARGKGSFATTVTVTYLDIEGYTHDTSVFIVLDVQNALPAQIDMATTKFDLGSANAPCGSMSGPLRVWNSRCGIVKIVGVRWAVPDTEFSASFGRLPIVLGTSDTTDLQLTYTPKQIGKKASQLIVSIEVDGVRRDTSITVSGTGRSAFDARIVNTSIAFDSLLLCDTREREAQIVNASCDEMIITRADLGTGAGYRVVSPVLPVVLHPSDTVTIRVLLDPKQSGPADDSLFVWMHLKTDVTEHVHSIGLHGYVVAAARELKLEPNRIVFQGIAPCSVRDTAVTLQNPNPCESLIVTSVTVSGPLPITLDPSLSLPVMISSRGLRQFRFHLEPVVDTQQSAFVHIIGNWIDTVIEISAVASSSGRALTLVDGDSVLETRPCIPVSITRSIVNEGCNPLLVDSLLLVTATGQTQLSLSSSRTLPFVLQPGEKTDVTIRYEPDGNGDGTGELRIVSGQARFSRGVKIQGVVTGSVPVMRMQVEGENAPGAVLRELPGRSISVQLRALDAVDQAIALRSAECDLSFDPDVLVLAQITPHAGWQLRDKRELAPGRVHCVFDWSGSAIAANDPIAQVFFETRLADTTTTQIRVSDVRLNPDDPDFERCVLSSLSTGEAVTFVVNDTCGSAIMRTLMQDKPLLEIVRIAPDPVTTASKSSSITLVSSVAQRGQFRIVAADGSIVRSFDQDLSAGSSTLPVPLAGIPSGSYTLTVSVPMMTRSTRFIIAR